MKPVKVTYDPTHGWPFPKEVLSLTPRQVARRRKQLNEQEIKAAPAAPF